MLLWFNYNCSWSGAKMGCEIGFDAFAIGGSKT